MADRCVFIWIFCFLRLWKKAKHILNLTRSFFLITWLTTKYKPLQLAHQLEDSVKKNRGHPVIFCETRICTWGVCSLRTLSDLALLRFGAESPIPQSQVSHRRSDSEGKRNCSWIRKSQICWKGNMRNRRHRLCRKDEEKERARSVGHPHCTEEGFAPLWPALTRSHTAGFA